MRCVMTLKAFELNSKIKENHEIGKLKHWKVFGDEIAEIFTIPKWSARRTIFRVRVFSQLPHFFSSLLPYNAFLVSQQTACYELHIDCMCAYACVSSSFVRASIISAATSSPRYSTAFIICHSGRESCGSQINLTPS